MSDASGTSKTDSLIAVSREFTARFDRAHSKSRPLIIDWEFAVKIREALKGAAHDFGRGPLTNCDMHDDESY